MALWLFATRRLWAGTIRQNIAVFVPSIGCVLSGLIICIRNTNGAFSMTNIIHAYAATQPGGALEPYTYDAGDLGPEQVEIAVSTCGSATPICP